MPVFFFIDGNGIERVLRTPNIEVARAAARAFVLHQTGSVAAGEVAARSVIEGA